jgi:hypothetical protein
MSEFINIRELLISQIIIKVYCNCSCLANVIVHPVIIDTNNIVTIIIIIIMSTHRVVMANRPDIINENTKEKTCTLIDVAIPAGGNVMKKEVEKKLKYKRLCIERQRMWNMKCVNIPVVTRATGIVTKA